MLVLLTLLFGCSDSSQSSEGFGVSGENGFDISDCIEFSQRFVDFGEVKLGEPIAPIEVELTDHCGVIELIQWGVDDPDEAFEVDFNGTDTVVVHFVKNDPGEWEAQWRPVPHDNQDLRDQFRGSVDIQMFAVVLSETDDD